MGAGVELMRTCCLCKTQKPGTREFFHRSPHGPGGLDPRCKACRKRGSRRVSTDLRTKEAQLCDGSKQCLLCRTVKPCEAFRLARNSFAGRYPYCKGCAATRSNVQQRVRRKEDWAFRLIQNVRNAYQYWRRKKGALDWAPSDVTREHLFELFATQEGRCGWTGITLDLTAVGKPWSVSLDRLDCSKGYLQGNVMLTCVAANLARNDSTPDEMLAFIKMIKET